MRKSITYFLIIVGLLFIFIPIIATLSNLDITPGFGIIQMIPFLIGLTSTTIGGYLFIAMIRNDQPRSLQADIGIRLGATGLVLAYTAGLADLLGIGTHVTTNEVLVAVETAPIRPVAGYLQQVGMIGAASIILFGMILYYSSKSNEKESLFQFLAPEETAK